MAQIVYVTPVDDISTGVKVAFEIYTATGMRPKIISDGVVTVLFDSIDAASLAFDRMSIESYVEKHDLPF